MWLSEVTQYAWEEQMHMMQGDITWMVYISIVVRAHDKILLNVYVDHITDIFFCSYVDDLKDMTINSAIRELLNYQGQNMVFFIK